MTKANKAKDEAIKAMVKGVKIIEKAIMAIKAIKAL